ncbi:unnamed protein product [Pylaiella littoralis]
MNRPATTGGSGGGAEIASPVVATEAGEPEVAEISGSDSDGIEEKESDERHDGNSDRRSEASSPGSSTLSWGDGYGGKSDDSDLMGGAWSLKGSCAAADPIADDASGQNGARPPVWIIRSAMGWWDCPPGLREYVGSEHGGDERDGGGSSMDAHSTFISPLLAKD